MFNEKLKNGMTDRLETRSVINETPPDQMPPGEGITDSYGCQNNIWTEFENFDTVQINYNWLCA